MTDYPVLPSNTKAHHTCPNCKSKNVACIGLWMGLCPAIFICNNCQFGYIQHERAKK